MEYYLASAGVHAEVARLRVAVSFLAHERVEWFAIASGDSQRPQTWMELKEANGPHFNGIPKREALQRLRKCVSCRQCNTTELGLLGRRQRPS